MYSLYTLHRRSIEQGILTNLRTGGDAGEGGSRTLVFEKRKGLAMVGTFALWRGTENAVFCGKGRWLFTFSVSPKSKNLSMGVPVWG